MLAPLLGLAVAYRRVAPLLAAAGLLGVIALTALPSLDVTRCGAIVPALMLLAFTTASRLDLRGALASLALLGAGVLALSFTDPVLEGVDGAAFVGPLTLLAWIGGRVARSLGLLGSRLEERTRLLERERDHTARLATEIERRRVGARLDAAARAELARMVELSRAGEAARRPTIRSAPARSSRRSSARRATTLDEIRGVLGSLRGDGADDRRATPTLAELEALVARGASDRTGRAPRRRGRAAAPCPPGVELTLYRLLQHALAGLRRGLAAQRCACATGPTDWSSRSRGPATSAVESAEAVHAARERASVHGGSLRVLAGEAGSTVLSALVPVTAPRAAVS